MTSEGTSTKGMRSVKEPGTHQVRSAGQEEENSEGA